MKAYRLLVFSLLVLLLVVHWGRFFGFQQGASALAWASELAQNAVAPKPPLIFPKPSAIKARCAWPMAA